MTVSTSRLQKGCLLIAEPYIGDDNFERTIILLCEHNEEGSFGFIVNKVTNLSLQEVVDEINVDDVSLNLGGPVEQNTLHFLHRASPNVDKAVEVQQNLYWGGDYDQIKSMINNRLIGPSNIRFFLGYSGWSAGQLEQELEEGTWIIAETDADTLFDTPAEQLWRVILKEMGGTYKMKANYPTDPRLN